MVEVIHIVGETIIKKVIMEIKVVLIQGEVMYNLLKRFPILMIKLIVMSSHANPRLGRLMLSLFVVLLSVTRWLLFSMI